jgi:hypothetical protein
MSGKISPALQAEILARSVEVESAVKQYVLLAVKCSISLPAVVALVSRLVGDSTE